MLLFENRNRLIAGALLMLYTALGFGVSLEPVSETKLDKTVFADRTESEGVYRDTASAPSLNLLFVPVSVFISNLNTTIREITGEVMSFGFEGGQKRSPRLGNLDQIGFIENNVVVVRTSQALIGWNPVSEKEVWRRPHADKPSTYYYPFHLGVDGTILQRSEVTGVVNEINGHTGETVSSFSPAKELGEIVSVLGKNEFLFLNQGVFSSANAKGEVAWRVSKVAPHKSFGQKAVRLSTGDLLLGEYISATHPDENLKRRTLFTVVDQHGKDVWSTLGYLYFLAQGKNTVYLQERTDDRETIINALDTATGRVRWKVLAESEKESGDLPSAEEHDGKLFLGYGSRLAVLDPQTGKTLAQLDSTKRKGTRVLGVNRDNLVVLDRDAAAPDRQYLVRIKVRE